MLEKRKGTYRSNRIDTELLNSSFKIDDKSFWNLMGYVSKYLERINYFNLENKVDGNWRELIEYDPVFYMIEIINHPVVELNQIEQECSVQIVDSIFEEKIYSILIEWKNKLETWSRTLSNHGQSEISNKIQSAFEDIIVLELNTFETYKASKLVEPKDNSKELSSIDYEKMISTFLKVIFHIQRLTKKYLKDFLYKEHSLMPNNAMYVAFSLIYKKVQSQINDLSSKHLEFYYLDVLKQKPFTGRASKAIVYFDLLPDINYSMLEKGTLMSAGKMFKSKTDIQFETEKSLIVYPISVSQLFTMYFCTNPFVKVGTNEGIVSSVSTQKLMDKGKRLETTKNWKIFGANKKSFIDTQIEEKNVQNLGFVLCSSCLLLKEGQRQIDIQLNFHDNDNSLWTLVDQIAKNKKLDFDVAFSSVFDEAFKTSISTKKGWLLVDTGYVTSNRSHNAIILTLKLKSSAPEMVQNRKLNNGFNWPAIKVELNELAPVYAYSFFKEVSLDTIKINVQANKIKNLSLYNNVGKLPLNKPFDLFGPRPEIGSFFQFGNSEVFSKNLKKMELNLNWENLPNDYGGFDTYYKGYNAGIDNSSFKVSPSFLNEGEWKFDSENTYNLFETKKAITPEGYESCKLVNSTSFVWNENELSKIKPDYDLIDPIPNKVTTLDGFFKLSLVSPEYAFGNSLFTKGYVEVAMYNAKSKTPIPFPNKPYVPKVKSLELSYSASDTLFFKEDLINSALTDNTCEFFHVTPYGIEGIIVGENVRSNSVFPSYLSEGYLFIGLDGVKGDTTINLFFDLVNKNTNVNNNDTSLRWEYWKDNQWELLDKDFLLSDGTNSFRKAGIIELVLPKESEDLAYYWLRISTDQGAETYPEIKGIYTNATTAICTSVNENIIGQKVIKGSINKMAGKFPNIKKVTQPVDSFAGCLTESKETFYTRVSERIRHKGRAVSRWDYERLILQNFDDVDIVKCTNLDQNFHPVAGRLNIAILSDQWEVETPGYFSQQYLDSIANFLKKMANAFVDISVINPKIEHLRVNCVIRFKKEDNGGYYINLLNKKINQFLSPVNFIEEDIGGFGGSIAPTMVIGHVENLDFVDQVIDLSIEHIIEEDLTTYTLGVYKNGERINSTTPWSILAPKKSHNIIVDLDGNMPEDESVEVGIGTMEVSQDFIIEGEEKEEKKSDLVELTEAETEGISNSILVFKNYLEDEQ